MVTVTGLSQSGSMSMIKDNQAVCPIMKLQFWLIGIPLKMVVVEYQVYFLTHLPMFGMWLRPRFFGTKPEDDYYCTYEL
jgi:hypothetical protein